MGAAFISGFSIFINKFGVSVGTASSFTFLKNMTVALLLTSLFLTAKKWPEIAKLNCSKWLQLALIGFVGGSIPFILFFKGLALTSAAQGGLIQKTMFIFIAILAVIFLKEKISWRFALGALLIFASNVFLIKNLNLSFGKGELLIFGATLLWAMENVISKTVLKNLSGGLVAWGRMSFGAIFIFIYLLMSGEISAIHNLSLNQIGWIMITSTLLFGYVFTWYSGLKKVPVSVASAILLFGSVITTLASFAYARNIDQAEIISVAVAFLGLVILIEPLLSGYEIKTVEKKYQRT
jgi:drug/metabolite transporter (DMT)-like permease